MCPCHKNDKRHNSYLLIWKMYSVICYTYCFICNMLFLITELPYFIINPLFCIYTISFVPFTEGSTAQWTLCHFYLKPQWDVNCVNVLFCPCIVFYASELPKWLEAVAKCVTYKCLVYMPFVHCILYVCIYCMYTCKYLWYLVMRVHSCELCTVVLFK